MAAQVVRSFSLCSWTNEVYILSGPKGQLILKQNCQAVTALVDIGLYYLPKAYCHRCF